MTKKIQEMRKEIEDSEFTFLRAAQIKRGGGGGLLNCISDKENPQGQ